MGDLEVTSPSAEDVVTVDVAHVSPTESFAEDRAAVSCDRRTTLKLGLEFSFRAHFGAMNVSHLIKPPKGKTASLRTPFA
jgi:hypothetical protein